LFRYREENDMNIARIAAATAVYALLVTAGAAAQDKGAVPYKVISTSDFIKAKNPRPGERLRVDILTQGAEGAKHLSGQLSAIPPGKPGEKPQYHYHAGRESIIQILSGDVTEMIEGKPVPLKPGDVIYIAPGTKHTMVNNSTTAEVKYMEFYSPIAPDNVPVKD
jgi:quercetin dioxygenase-like cupin family protein